MQKGWDALERVSGRRRHYGAVRGFRLLVVLALSLTMCTVPEDRDDIPPCPDASSTPVTIPGLTGRISYESLGGGGGHCHGIFVINADGSGRRRITGAQLLPFGTKWSPDGRQLAFGGVCSPRPLGNICLINADGTGLRALTNGPGHEAYPAWSPDGTRIAFARNIESLGPADIYVINVDGTGERRVTSDPGNEWGPSWSADGQSLVYVGNEGTDQLRLVRVSGGPSTVLARGGTANQHPAFSHDGRRIIFSSNRAGKEESDYQTAVRNTPGGALLRPPSGAHDVYVVDVDGRNLRRLTTEGANYAGAWSPDDRHIAFTSDRDGRQEVYVMRADGTGQARLTNHPEDGAGDPAWAP